MIEDKCDQKSDVELCYDAGVYARKQGRAIEANPTADAYKKYPDVKNIEEMYNGF